jgi:hypothetical protein
MKETMEPIPVGTVVTYHGSLSYDPEKRYVIMAHQNPEEMFTVTEMVLLLRSETLAEAYPDGVAYTIWPEGMPQKFGLREHMIYRIYRVRRGSLTEVS